MGGGPEKWENKWRDYPHICNFYKTPKNNINFHQYREIVIRPKRTHDIMGGMEYMI